MKKQIEALSFYNSVITDEFVSGLLDAEGVVHRDGIFKASVVVWLMLSMRLKPNRSLAKALEELRFGASQEVLSRADGSIRARSKRISNSTGGYSQARQRLPLEVVEKVADKLGQAIESVPRSKRNTLSVYVVDGSTVRVSHSKKNLNQYPPHKNQHGAAHFPLVHLGVATNALTGTALRPAIGAYNGTEATSELDLADELLARLPKGSVALGDRYYGCFRFAYGAVQNQLQVLCRMKELNTKRFIGTPETLCGEQVVNWTPSAREQTKYPQLPPNAAVQGRMIWTTLSRPGFRAERLVLFTTLLLPADEIVELYALRWNVELDLRDLKTTIGLEFIDARSPEIIRKEIILGVAAYNLVRLAIITAAHALKLKTRKLSFTRTLQRIESLSGLLLSSATDVQKQKTLQRALTDIKGLVLHQRKRPPEPRKVWPRGEKKFFTTSTTRNAERNNISGSKSTISKNNSET